MGPPPPLMSTSGADKYDSNKSVFTTFMNIVNTSTHLLLGAIACCAFVFANSSSQTTSLKQHIYLCVSGYVILMSQAILSISPFTGWARTLSFHGRRTVHWIMQVVGSVLAITGSIVRITNVNDHLVTPHGTLGVVAMLFTFLTLIGGVLNLYGSRFAFIKVVRFAHACFGCVTITLALLTLFFGFDKSIYRNSFGDNNSNMLMAFTVLSLLGTVAGACFNNIKKLSK